MHYICIQQLLQDSSLLPCHCAQQQQQHTAALFIFFVRTLMPTPNAAHTSTPGTPMLALLLPTTSCSAHIAHSMLLNPYTCSMNFNIFHFNAVLVLLVLCTPGVS
jgi:hypothetical protein